MDKFEIARRKYKPSLIRYLLIAETPPKSDSKRFFYFENVMEQDSLFLETMKVLYSEETENIDVINIRKNKSYFLNRFQNDGYYLIDSLEKPFEDKYSSTQKINLIKSGLPNLLMRIKSILNNQTKVILISATVYKANYLFLKQNGINVINTELIDFPGSGGQKKFREKLRKIIQ